MSISELVSTSVQEKEVDENPFFMALDVMTGEVSVDLENVGVSGITSQTFLEPVRQERFKSLLVKLLTGEMVSIQDGSLIYNCVMQKRQGNLVIVKITPNDRVIEEDGKPLDQTIGTVSDEVDMVLDPEKMSEQVEEITTRAAVFLHEIRSPLTSLVYFFQMLDNEKLPVLLKEFQQNIVEFMEDLELLKENSYKNISNKSLLFKMREKQTQLCVLEQSLHQRFQEMSSRMDMIQMHISTENVREICHESFQKYMESIFPMLPKYLDRMSRVQQTMGLLNPHFDVPGSLNRTTFSSAELEESLRAIPPNMERADEDLVIEGSVPAMEADKELLLQGLVNLVRNAFSFSPEEPGAVNISITESEGMVKFVVTDSGPGVSVEVREKIFEKFKQASQEGRKKDEHSGLGLAITKRIVEGHGGTITVGDASGGGAAFEIQIPLRSGE